MLERRAAPAGYTVIMGAAGRDFHNFNMVFRDNPHARVVAFTAAQIPDIAGRRYPAALAGYRYPDGIPILPEAALPELIRRAPVDWVYLSYSDLAHEEVMHKASLVLAAGANFALLGPEMTMLRPAVPVISVCAVRTGAGKSPLSRAIVTRLRGHGLRVVAIRHPMPYGDLERQAVQRFTSYGELDAASPTIEEREEYEPYLDIGATVYAGVDYGRILAAAEDEADVIVWDGGNNDLPFIRPHLHIVVLDACRPGHEITYHPGEANLRMADVLVVNKVSSAAPADVARVEATARALRPSAHLLRADLAVTADRPDLIRNARVAVVEDGPTLTHGGMTRGAGAVAARQYGAAEIVDARPYAAGTLAETFAAFPHLRGDIPAMGYRPAQVADLAATLQRMPVDAVIDATPVHLARLLDPGHPLVDVRYDFREQGDALDAILDRFVEQHVGPAPAGSRI